MQTYKVQDTYIHAIRVNFNTLDYKNILKGKKHFFLMFCTPDFSHYSDLFIEKLFEDNLFYKISGVFFIGSASGKMESLSDHLLVQKYIQDSAPSLINTITVSEENLSHDSFEAFCNMFILTDSFDDEKMSVEKFVFCDSEKFYNKVVDFIEQL